MPYSPLGFVRKQAVNPFFLNASHNRQIPGAESGMIGANKGPISVEKALEIAVGLQRAGDLPGAEGIYRKILQRQPNHAVASYLLSQVDGALASISSGAPSGRFLLDA